jgi:arsenate reductase-like glutaredoxin family protein
VTLFHKPSSQPSIRVLTLLKQANATSVAHATEDQASSHDAQNKAERTEFELDVTEAPPTGDQLKNIFEYLGSGSAGKLIQGATSQQDALQKLKENGDAFQRPVVRIWSPSIKEIQTDIDRLWTGIKEKQVCQHSARARFGGVVSLIITVVGENESEILALLRSIPKEEP